MKTASWSLLAFAAVVTLLYSLLSVERAYGTFKDQLGGVSLQKLAADRPEVETAVRSRRATASAYSIGFATLFLAIILIPYRRGEVWAWWSLLIAILAISVVVLIRIPLLGTGVGGTSGGGAAIASIAQLLIAGLGLALGAGRLRHRHQDVSA